jgi:DNA polymerase-3 subunit alpha
MNLFLDIETTGLPGKGHNWSEDYMEYPYIVSIAWEHKGIVKDFIVHQEGRKIPLEATKVHGITTKMANNPEVAQPASFVLSVLMCDAKEAGNIVGHNIYFDTSIIKANVLRLHGAKSKQAKIIEEVLHKDKRIDTMRNSVRLFNKWPKLKELYEYLFNGETFDAHSAKEDMLACKRCFNEMRKRKML